MLPLVKTLLVAAPAVTALVGTKVYRHGTAPQGTQSPYITWALVTGIPENHLDGTPPVDRIAVQIDAWSNNTGTGDREVEEIATAVRDTLEPHAHMTAINFDGWDSESKRFRMSMSFDFWQDRPS